MPKMSAIDLKALLSAERYDALSAMAASKLSDERASALNYYMGDMSKDMPAPDGRSKAVSSDVADTIEGLMPPLMEIFASGDEVVRFAPVGPEDTQSHTIEEQARDTVNESTLRQGDDGLNEASRLIRITEHYVRMDYDGTGEAALYRVTTAGEEGEVLLRDGRPDV